MPRLIYDSSHGAALLRPHCDATETLILLGSMFRRYLLSQLGSSIRYQLHTNFTRT